MNVKISEIVKIVMTVVLNVSLGFLVLATDYYPDYTEANQGVTGNGTTIKAYVDTISSDSATLILRHNSGSATTTYTLGTDETVPSNIKVIIEKGAVLSINSGRTLTINGPFEAGLFQVFGGAGMVAFGDGAIKEFNCAWIGMVPDGSDVSAKFRSAINYADGIPVRINVGTYNLSTMTSYAPTKDIFIVGEGAKYTVLDGGGDQRLAVANTKSVKAKGITFTNWGVAIYQTASTVQKIENIDIQDCVFSNCTSGILCAAQIGSAYINNNIFKDLSGSGAVSGIRFGTDSPTNDDLTQKIVVSNNKFMNITSTGTDQDVHGVFLFGTKAIVTGNIIEDISNGNHGTGAEGIYTKCYYTNITNNLLVNAGGYQSAICSKGSGRVEQSSNRGYGNIISDNQIIFEDQAYATNGIYIHNTDILCSNNRIEGANSHGIYGDGEPNGYVDNLMVINNVIYRSGSYGISFKNPSSSITISGNDIQEMQGNGAYCYGIALGASSGTCGSVVVTNNRIQSGSDNAATNSIRGIQITPTVATADVFVANNKLDISHDTVTIYGIKLSLYNVARATVVNNDLTRLQYEGWDKAIYLVDRPATYCIHDNSGFPDESNMETGFTGSIKASYDYTIDPNGTVTIGNYYIPPNAVITKMYYKVTEQPNSPGSNCTIAIGFADDATGLKAATDEDDASWQVGWHNGIQDGSATNFSEKTTESRGLQIRIYNGDLTAGAFTVYCEYMIVD